MAKLPKSLIKKYGISKKAWSIFRAQKGSARKTKRTHSKVKYMARRKHYGKKHGSKGFNMGKIVSILAGTAIAVAYEVFVSPMIPLAANIKNWIELALGLLLAVMPKMPTVVRAAGTALAVVNAYAIIYPMLAGGSSASSGSVGTPYI